MTNIKEILPIQSVSYNTTAMYIYLVTKLKDMGIEFETERGNIYAVKNTNNSKIMPCFVSHIDTVHAITDEIHVLEFGKILTGFNRIKNKQTGIGGDDKVGIYYCLRALEELDAVKVAFFRDEEVGCHGSKDANMDFFNDVSMVLQGDRKGHTDFVTKISGIDLSSKEFQDDVEDIVKTHGYKFCTFGGTTDVGQLRKNGIEVPVVNISCGYYNPHSADEFINMLYVENGLDMYLEIAKTFGHNYYYVPEHVPYVYTPPKTNYNYQKTTPTTTTTTVKTPQESEEDLSFVYCPEVDDMVSISDVYWDTDYSCYQLLIPGEYTSMSDIKDDMNEIFDYYEIELENKAYEGIIIKKGAGLTEETIIAQAIAEKIILESDVKKIKSICKITRQLFNMHYGDTKI